MISFIIQTPNSFDTVKLIQLLCNNQTIEMDKVNDYRIKTFKKT